MAAVPHPELVFGQLLESLKSKDPELTVSREILTRLLDLYISCWDFDEEWYLANYPDIHEAIKRGHFESGWGHFKSVGYFEGRLGAQPSVDEEWYVRTYPDVAKAMLDGKITSALEHYVQFGYKEGRLPRDPAVHPRWYAPRYLPATAIDDEAACTEHFVRVGYRKLAVPAPPR